MALMPAYFQQCPSAFAPPFPSVWVAVRRRSFISCCSTESKTAVFNGRVGTRGADRDEIRPSLPSKGRMAADTLNLLKDCQLSVKQVNPRQEIQEALVDIGDKDPSFIGSREWIGAIELSFVLDKLLGVSCKVINVRSGAELLEKCQELALHFETQGTPVMIGGGVLAYTLLGVDYNEASGDCAFLILDSHYMGSDDLKKIVNRGWCGWKKAVDSKGKSFFLHDKFYNLLLP